MRRTRFEYSSAGDRVRGILWHAEASDPTPLVLVGHARGSSKDAAELDLLARSWTGAGAAVAAIDLPLHGARASGKLGDRILRAVGAETATDELDADLWRHLVQQTETDLRRALILLAARPDIDRERLAFAGFGLGAELGAGVCTEGSELCAAVLARLPRSSSVARGTGIATIPLVSDEITKPASDEAWRHLASGLGLSSD